MQNVLVPKYFAVRKKTTVHNSRGGFTRERRARILPETMTQRNYVKGNIIFIKGIIKDRISFLILSFVLHFIFNCLKGRDGGERDRHTRHTLELGEKTPPEIK